jgi:hypothetical protein
MNHFRLPLLKRPFPAQWLFWCKVHDISNVSREEPRRFSSDKGLPKQSKSGRAHTSSPRANRQAFQYAYPVDIRIRIHWKNFRTLTKKCQRAAFANSEVFYWLSPEQFHLDWTNRLNAGRKNLERLTPARTTQFPKHQVTGRMALESQFALLPVQYTRCTPLVHQNFTRKSTRI